mmetsp:Transcript_21715/g.64677  ORF Transcript_21715/g.64677 Transcript_21715/m.64677 type:complete len:915 (+) Transcript_21715:79-2823(+)
MFQTIVYLACLALAIAWCYRRCESGPKLAASVGCIAVTWFYIIRFMVYYDGPNSFDGAYADVIWGGAAGNWGLTQMLLTWAVVAMVWSHEAAFAYQIFGLFGAMSAAFLTYDRRPVRKEERSVPVAYAACSLVAFVCIWMLPRTSTLGEMSWWLWGLHMCLVVPKFTPAFLEVDKCAVYLVLALLSFVVHVAATPSPWPTTDCRLSISIDLVVCSLLTLHFVHQKTASVPATAACGVLAPLLSPGCLLALAGAAELGLQSRLVTWVQQLVARQALAGGAATWANLGFWKEQGKKGVGYEKACQELALLVGRAALAEGDAALCVGCGRGDELGLLHRSCKLGKTTGLDPHAGGDFAPPCEGVRLVEGSVEEMMKGCTGFRPGDFTAIVAVDSVYHCDRAGFFDGCATLLARGKKVAVSDVVLREGAPIWVRWALQAMNIPARNHWTKEEYLRRLKAAGLEVCKWESLEPHVLAHWLPSALSEHLDYVLVSAAVVEPRRRPRAAVVGSGMTGCLIARQLSETHDCTIFEAGPAINLAGRAPVIDGVPCDVPLRMIAPHYYLEMVEVMKEVAVETRPTRFDICFFSSALADFGRTLHKTFESPLMTMVDRLKFLPTLVKLTAVILFCPPTEDTSLKDYMAKFNLTDSFVYRIYMLPQLSWMLSCDVSMVEAYPATAVVGFIKAVNPVVGCFKAIVRIHPQNSALQDLLVKGIHVKLNQAIGPIPEDRTICGERFDQVIIATEAGAVPKILGEKRKWAKVFNEFEYHKSSVVLHRDPALMPKEKEDWRVLNVASSESEKGCMLSVWQNAYYDMDPRFKGDVFQTWNPHRRPAEGTIEAEFHFQRVVHSAKTSRHLREAVDALQGKDDFFFAGAYAPAGMGLLEEASKSAKHAVRLVQQAWEAKEALRTRLGGRDAKVD